MVDQQVVSRVSTGYEGVEQDSDLFILLRRYLVDCCLELLYSYYPNRMEPSHSSA
jgi:hypothetical protein